MVLLLPRIAMLDVRPAASLTGIMYESDEAAVFLGQCVSDCIDSGNICKLPLFQCSAC